MYNNVIEYIYARRLIDKKKKYIFSLRGRRTAYAAVKNPSWTCKHYFFFSFLEGGIGERTKALVKVYVPFKRLYKMYGVFGEKPGSRTDDVEGRLNVREWTVVGAIYVPRVIRNRLKTFNRIH